MLGGGYGPFKLMDQTTLYPTVKDPTGYTEVSDALVEGQTTGVFITLGDSMFANHNGTTLYTPVNALAHQLNPHDGKVYQIKDMVLGASNEIGFPESCMISRIADKLVTAGVFQRVIMVPAGGIGSTSSAHWMPGGPINHRLGVAFNWCLKKGWPITAVLHQGGPNDAVAGVSSAQYQSNVIATQNALIAMGCNVPWVIAKCTMVSNAVNATIQAAQDALVNNPANRFAGPNIDSLTGAGNRAAGGTHLISAGCDAGAALWVPVLDAMF